MLWVNNNASFSGFTVFHLCKVFLLFNIGTAILLIALFPFTVQAVLSATTINQIHGKPPYLTLDNGQTKITTTDELLAIILSNNVKYMANNTSSATNPIILPNINETLVDVKMIIPTTVNNINMNTLLAAPYNYWRDDDGDGQGTNGVNATGSLRVVITDSNNKSIKRNATLNLCDTLYYKVVLSNTASVLSTQYGVPNSTNYNAANAIYYIKPNVTTPYACSAQPNLTYSSRDKIPVNSTTSFDGPASQWNTNKGFFLQNINDPASNFPTTGANNLYFKLTVADGQVGNMDYKKEPANSGLSLKITGSGNVAIITLIGPKGGDSISTAGKAVPTTFTIYADKGLNNKVYSFKISKWFITDPNVTKTYDANYCRTTYGNSYRIPKIVDYTNSSTDCDYWNNMDWSKPQRVYMRKIKGGLFAEWGKTDKEYYTGSDFDEDASKGFYWTSDAYSYENGQQCLVHNSNGTPFPMKEIQPQGDKFHYGCVTP